MNFKILLERHPDLALDRHRLSFSRETASADIAKAYARSGVVLLKGALPPASLEAAASGFRQYLRAQPPSAATSNARGSWHSPWLVRQGDFFPAAGILAAVVRSWIWDVVEEICQSSRIVLLLKFCTARHGVDDLLGLGAHQDAKVVDHSVPLSLWIPLQEIVPGRCSGLGFVVPPPDHILPTLAHDDVGADYLMREPANLWLPRYALGDLSIHSRYSVHYTTGFGTRTDRYSLEVRAMPRMAAPVDHLDPALYVARRNGQPSFVRAHGSPDKGADAFLGAAMHTPAALPIGQKGLAG
jgi:hypothetical protein